MPLCHICEGESIAEGQGCKYIIIRCYLENKLIHEQYIVDKKLHREDGPAVRKWNINGVLIRESYYINGYLHREDGHTSRIWNNNGILITEEYCNDGRFHREDGVAVCEWDNNGNLVFKGWSWKGHPHTFGMMQTNSKLSYKRGEKVEIKDLITSGKVILRFMKKTKSIKRRYEKIIEESIYWSFPGLGKILLELNGGI